MSQTVKCLLFQLRVFPVYWTGPSGSIVHRLGPMFVFGHTKVSDGPQRWSYETSNRRKKGNDGFFDNNKITTVTPLILILNVQSVIE